MSLNQPKHAFGHITIDEQEFRNLRNYTDDSTNGHLALQGRGSLAKIERLISNRRKKGLGESLLIGSGFHHKRMYCLNAGILDDRGHPSKFYERMGYIDAEHELFAAECYCMSCIHDRDDLELDFSIPMVWNGTQ